MHNNSKCNGIEIADCKNYRVGDCNFCIENGIIYVIKEDSSKIPLSIDKKLGQGQYGTVHLFKSEDGEHELAVKVTNDKKEIDASKDLAMLPDEIKKHIVPSIFTKQSITGLKDEIKMIMPRFFSLSDKAKEMSISINSERGKINKILEIFVKLCEITKILNYRTGLTYSDQKLANFLIDESEKVYFGDIGSFNSSYHNRRNQPHQIFEDFCQIAFNGQAYRGEMQPYDFRTSKFIHELYLSDPVRQIVNHVIKNKFPFSDINQENLASFINEFNKEPIIEDDISVLSEEDKEYLEEYGLQVNKPNVGLRIYMELKRILFELKYLFEEPIYLNRSDNEDIPIPSINDLKNALANTKWRGFFWEAYIITDTLNHYKKKNISTTATDLISSFNSLHNILMKLNKKLDLMTIFNFVVRDYRILNSLESTNLEEFEKLNKLVVPTFYENKLQEMYPNKTTKEEQLEQLKSDMLALLPIIRTNLENLIIKCNQKLVDSVGGDFNAYKNTLVHQIKYTKN